jgi:AcrR family transcriptional regulator
VVEHREQRRAALLDAAATLMRRGGAFTVAEVASEVGLSRSAVYEYYSSAAELIADVLVDELMDWSDALAEATSGQDDPVARIEAWVSAVLLYVADGRHALVRAAGSVELPATRRAEVQARHRDLVAPLQSAIEELGVDDAARVAGFVWGAMDSSITRIEAGVSTADGEQPALVAFVQGGLARLQPGD